MTTCQIARLRWLAGNDQPVTLASLIALWHCSRDTACSTLALCGYMLVAGAWHHPDHVPATEPIPEPAPTPEIPAPCPPSSVLCLPSSPARRSVNRPLPLWLTCDPADLLADLEATKVTRTWLLANVEPADWPHPHRTPCHDCKLWQPCLNLSCHRQATICEAVIAQRRITHHADLPDQSDLHRAAPGVCSSRQTDLRDLHPAEHAALAAE